MLRLAPRETGSRQLVDGPEGIPEETRSGVERILPVVYDELREVARRCMAREPADHTLEPTALVHEAYLRLSKDRRGWDDGRYFVAAAAVAMRRILIERARRYGTLKRGDGLQRESLSRVGLVEESDPVDLLALEGALERLEAIDEVKCAVVTLRYILGCTAKETAEALGISYSRVKQEWVFAKAWLRRELDRR